MNKEINKLKEQLQHLKPNERAGIMGFIDRLKQRYGEDLRLVALFGSKARGDFDEEHDLDVLIFLRIKPLATWRFGESILRAKRDMIINHLERL